MVCGVTLPAGLREPPMPARSLRITQVAVGRRRGGRRKRALAVSRALNIEEVLREGSTDSNVPMNLGIPAITISGGASRGAPALSEAFDPQDSWRATRRALLLAIAQARQCPRQP